MSAQAGMFYFDHREVAGDEAGAIRSWIRLDDSNPPADHRHGGAFLVSAHSHPNGRMPQHAPGQDPAVTFDGRLDNRSDLLLLLRDTLSANTSDAALAAAAYVAWGTEGLAHLIGDWSLVICDRARRAIVLASDFAGVRPLYYCVQSNRVLWSTRLQPLVDWAQAYEIDDVYVAGLLAHGGCPNRTPYRGVYPVPAGHAVEVTVDGVRAHRFWAPPVADTIRYSHESEYEDHLRSLFRDAVRCRVPTAAPCLCELSGGLDSSSVVAMAAEMMRTGQITTEGFTTLSFEHEMSLDKPFYTAVERFHGFRSVHVSTADYPFVTQDDAGGAAPAFWGLLKKHTAAIAREIGATAYLTGELGDLMMGNWSDDSDQVAGLLHTGRFASAFKQAFAWSQVLRVPIYGILGRALLSSLPCSLGAAKACSVTDCPDQTQDPEDSIALAFRTRTGLSGTDTLFSRDWIHARPERRKHFRGLMRTLELRGLQPPEPLEHLNYVHPYAHRPLVSFLLSIPADVLCRPGEPRRLMRRAFRQLWPAELRRRRSKDGFGAVFHESLRPLANQLLRSGRPLQVVERGYVDRRSIERRLDRLSQSLSCNEPQLRQVILLEVWLRTRASNKPR